MAYDQSTQASESQFVQGLQDTHHEGMKSLAETALLMGAVAYGPQIIRSLSAQGQQAAAPQGQPVQQVAGITPAQRRNRTILTLVIVIGVALAIIAL